MQEKSPPPSDPSPQQGISLDELTAAYANAMEPGADDTAPSQPQGEALESDELAKTSTSAEENVDAEVEGVVIGPPDPLDENIDEQEDSACELSPKTILEAMLFVGNRENDPLASQQAAALMRGVETSDIPKLVNELKETGATAFLLGGFVVMGAPPLLIYAVRKPAWDREKEATPADK